MVLLVEGNSENGAHVRSEIGNLIGSRHLLKLKVELIFSIKDLFKACTACVGLPSPRSSLGYSWR